MSTSSDIMKQKTFWQQYGSLILILGGILVGALIGALAPSVGTAIKPIGDIFLNLLFTIVVPLVFVSIASAVGSMANMKRLGRILGGTIGTFIFTGAIASVCVLIWVNIFSPSAGTTIEMTSTEVGEAKSAAELIVTSLTVSDFPELWTKSNMLPLIIFSIIFGFCVSACGGDESPMGKLLINLNDIIMKFVGVIMTIAPLGLGRSSGTGRLFCQPGGYLRPGNHWGLWPFHVGLLSPVPALRRDFLSDLCLYGRRQGRNQGDGKTYFPAGYYRFRYPVFRCHDSGEQGSL